MKFKYPPDQWKFVRVRAKAISDAVQRSRKPAYCAHENCAHAGTPHCLDCLPWDPHCSHYSPKLGGDNNG